MTDYLEVRNHLRHLFASRFDLPTGDAEVDSVCRLLVSLLKERGAGSEGSVLYGHWYLFLGDLASATDCYRGALETEPMNCEASLGLAIVFDRLGQEERAAEWASRAIKGDCSPFDFLLFNTPRTNAMREVISTVAATVARPQPERDWEAIRRTIAAHVSGLDDIVDRVVDRLRASYSSLRIRSQRPRAVLAFYGAPGTGKESVARAIGLGLWGEERLLVVSASEFTAVLEISRIKSGWAHPWSEPEWVTRWQEWGSVVVVLTGIHEVSREGRMTIAKALTNLTLANPWGRPLALRGSIIVFSITIEELAQVKGTAADKIATFLGREIQRCVDESYPFVFSGAEEARSAIRAYWERAVDPRLRMKGLITSLEESAIDYLSAQAMSPHEGLAASQRLIDEELVPLLDRRAPGRYSVGRDRRWVIAGESELRAGGVRDRSPH